jgi:NADH-quinone oxidoreductase subunit G
MPIAELGSCDRVLVAGSFLRKDHPLIAHRLRQAAKRGAKIHVLHSVDDDWLMPIAGRKIVAPSELAASFAGFEEALKGGQKAAVLLGNFAQQHSQAGAIHAAAQALARATNATLGFLGEAANSVGGYLAGLPRGGSLDDVLAKKAIVVLNAEPELDCANPQRARSALSAAEFVVVLSPYRTGLEYANVILPVGPFTETAGSFVNTEGRLQSFYATANPLGEARPAWKVLRVIGSLLGVPGFDYDDVQQVRDACLAGRSISSLLSNEIAGMAPGAKDVFEGKGVQRIADVPIYFTDPLVRRSAPLQETKDAERPRAWMNAKLLARLGLGRNDLVLVRQGEGQARLQVALDERLPDECVRIAAGHPATAGLGAMTGTVTLEKVAMGKAA